jgi:quinol monooxygenase YgiN
MVYARTAFFQGTLTAPERQEFQDYMRAEVVPILQTFPGIQTLQLNFPEVIDPAGPQDLLLMMQHTYADQAAMDAALSSERRTLSMHATNKILDKLAILVYHVNFQREALEPSLAK